MRFKNKLAQEEMVGFALIVILVAVIILVFIMFLIREPVKENVESYEVGSFIDSMLQYSTSCGNNNEPHLSIQKLMIACENREICLDERESCEVLEEDLQNILEVSWKVGEDNSLKGYVLNISSENREIIFLEKGNITRNSKGFSERISGADINFITYY